MRTEALRLEARVPAAAIFVVLLLGSLAAPALAQEQRPQRPIRPLFDGGVGDWGHDVSISGTAGVGYDDNILADVRSFSQGGNFDPAQQQSGGIGQLSASLSYGLSRRSVTIASSIGSALRLYRELDTGATRQIKSHFGSVGFSARPARFTTLSASHAISHRPFNTSALFLVIDEDDLSAAEAGLIGVGDVDVSLIELDIDGRYRTYTTAANVSHQVSDRTTLTATYRNRLATSTMFDGWFGNHNWSGRYRREMTEHIGFRMGYGFGVVRYATGASRTRNHRFDFGFDYNRDFELSFSRRTTVSFGTGSALTSGGGLPDGSGRVRFRLTGNVTLNHLLTRTWRASASFRRGVQFAEIMQAPVFSDTASASLGGPLNRRMTFASSLNASLGAIGAPGRNRRYHTWYGNATLQFALTRLISAGLVYSYYQYRFGEDVLLPPGVPGRINRHSARVQVTAMAPLFQRRSRHAAR